MGISLKTVLTLMASIFLCWGTTSAWAADEYHGFVKDPYYLIKGGKEVSPQDFATNPLKYLRSPAAYTALRDHTSQVVARPLDDAAFRELIVSDDVRIVECVGRIATDGITDTGKIGRHERGCYPGERLMETKVPGGWMKLISLGCYNPVYGDRPPPPTPVAGVCGSNAKRYSYTEQVWPAEGKLCKVGTPSPTSVIFPEAGRTTVWTCQGLEGGTKDLCLADRDVPPPPKVVVKKKVCTLVPVLIGTGNIPPSVVNLSGRLSESCIGPQWLPGLQVTSGGGSTSTYGYFEHCVEVDEK